MADRVPRGLFRRRARPAPPPEPDGSWGTVCLPFGRYFAAQVDLLTRERFKTTEPIDGLSPFCAAGEADPGLARYVDSERVNERVKADLRKDLRARLAESGADVLVLDNTSALLWHRTINGRMYTVISGERTDFMDLLCDPDESADRAAAFKPSHLGFTDELRAAYDDFVDACLANFDPGRIVLIRSHPARFWVDGNGATAPTELDRRDATLLDALDDHFAQRTGCRVTTAALRHFPASPQWHARNDELRIALERELVELGGSTGGPSGRRREEASPGTRREATAADHIVTAVRKGHAVDAKWLRAYFNSGGATYDDLLALAHLDEARPGRHDGLIRACVQKAVADPESELVSETRRHFERSAAALLDSPWCGPKLSRQVRWSPQIVIRSGRARFRFHGDGSIERFSTTEVPESDVDALAAGDVPVPPLAIEDLIGSWRVYLARARKGVRAAPIVGVPSAAALVDSCYWVDWAWVLDNERVVIRVDGSHRPVQVPEARTDLGFVFDPAVRICTVGGGLMDQVTHIALFDRICSAIGVDYYLDDFRYTWWRSHNGFEASRLAPQVEQKRMTRRVSSALLESFRGEASKGRLPWVYNQSRFWHDNGLPDALVVTRDYFNSQRLVQAEPPFPVLVYPDEKDLAGLMADPPAAVCFFTTQQRIEIAAESADAIRRVFSYRHLEVPGLPAEVAEVAAALTASPHVALHVRRGDFLHAHFDTDGWHARQDQYAAALEHLIAHEFGSSDFDVAVFSDDLDFVDAHREHYGLDLVTGRIRFVRGNTHYRSIFDSYLMALCPIIVGSVGFFAATTSLLADPPSEFVLTQPEGVRVEWRRTAGAPDADGARPATGPGPR